MSAGIPWHGGRAARRLGLATIVLAAPLASQTQGAADPGPVIRQEYAALDRHDVDGVFAVYADTIQYGELRDSALMHWTTTAALRDQFRPFLARNPRSHLRITHELDVGPFVIATQRMTGMADGKPVEIIDISQVRHGRVVAELETENLAGTPPLESQRADAAAKLADDAFARADPAAAMPAYGEPVLFHVWGEDSVRHMSRAQMREGFQKVQAANPHMRFVVVERAVQGRFVIVHERLTGMANGVRRDAFDVMEVRNGRIVAEWECPWL